MRSLFSLAAIVAVSAGTAVAGPFTDSLKPGNPTPKTISSIAFGPEGVLFLGDSSGSQVVAIATGDTSPAAPGDVNVDNIGEKLAAALGTTAANVTINDVKVNPASGNVFIAATRKGANGGPIVVKLGRDGKIAEVPMKNVPTANTTLPGNGRTAITGLAFVEGKVVVAGLSNEEFASTLWAVPYPFTRIDKGTGVEIYHGAHGKFETKSPVQSFVPYQIGGADYLLAAYTCTPLVKFPVADLKPGQKVRGTTIAELGNRNKPLDMIVYQKGGKDFVLIANSARGVMKLPAEPIATAKAITSRAAPKTGVPYESVAELEGELQLDKLDNERVLLLVKAQDGVLNLKTIPLP
jgi:hypothetical protein